MTVINSPPGSGDQRWHQGWRYLFHPNERLPPYAVVVALPLAASSAGAPPAAVAGAGAQRNVSNKHMR